MKSNKRVRLFFLQGLIITTVILSAGWMFLSQIITHLVLPLIASNHGWEITAEKGRWNIANGGKLQKVRLNSQRWSIEVSEIGLVWKWQGTTPEITLIELTDLKLSERPLGQRNPEHFHNIQLNKRNPQKKPAFVPLNKNTRVKITRATLNLGEPFPAEPTRVTLRVEETELGGQSFLLPARAVMTKDEVEILSADIVLTVELNKHGTPSWDAETRVEFFTNTPFLFFLNGATIAGNAKGIGIDFMEFDGALRKKNADLGSLKFATTFEAVARTGALDFQFTSELDRIINALGWEAESILSKHPGTQFDLKTKISWSPDGWLTSALATADEFLHARFDAARTPVGKWDVNLAQAQINIPQIAGINLTLEDQLSGENSHPSTKPAFLMKIKLTQLPEPLIKKAPGLLRRLNLAGDVVCTAVVQPEEETWRWHLNISGHLMELRANPLLWSASDWSLTAAGVLFNPPIFLDELKFSYGENCQLRISVSENSEKKIEFKNLKLSLLRDSPKAEGGILLRRGEITIGNKKDIIYHIRGTDIPSAAGWIMPVEDRKAEDWILAGRLFFTEEEVRIFDNVLRSPAECESCQMVLNGVLSKPYHFDVRIEGVGVDFTHFAHPSELILAALFKTAQETTELRGNTNELATESRTSSLAFVLSDCVVPRLGRGDVRGSVLSADGQIMIKDAVLALDIGGGTCDAVLSKRNKSWQLEKISVALKTISLADLQSLFPQNLVPYLSGKFTFNGEFQKNTEGELYGYGTAEWSDAKISAVPAVKKLLLEAAEKISPQFSKLQLESGHARFSLEGNNLCSDELFIYGDKGMLEISGKYNYSNDNLDSNVVFHLDTESLRKARVRIGGVTVAGQTLVTFGRQQDDFTTLPGVLPVRGKLNGNLKADWMAWLQSLGIPINFSEQVISKFKSQSTN